MHAPCQPCKRRLQAFQRGFIPHSVPNHSPTPSARRPRLDEGFETEEPLHGPGVVSWFPGPLQRNTRSMAFHVSNVAVRQGNGFFARLDSTTISSCAGVLPTTSKRVRYWSSIQRHVCKRLEISLCLRRCSEARRSSRRDTC